MNNVDPTVFSIASELFINLAAGWLGVVIIVPNFSGERGVRKWLVLTTDIVFAIVCLTLAFVLRKLL